MSSKIEHKSLSITQIGSFWKETISNQVAFKFKGTICPGSSDPFYIVSYYIKWATTSWTHCMFTMLDRDKYFSSFQK